MNGSVGQCIHGWQMVESCFTRPRSYSHGDRAGFEIKSVWFLSLHSRFNLYFVSRNPKSGHWAVARRKKKESRIPPLPSVPHEECGYCWAKLISIYLAKAKTPSPGASSPFDSVAQRSAWGLREKKTSRRQRQAGQRTMKRYQPTITVVILEGWHSWTKVLVSSQPCQSLQSWCLSILCYIELPSNTNHFQQKQWTLLLYSQEGITSTKWDPEKE